MDLDFALILVSLTSATGAIWLLDRLLLLPRRRAAAARLGESTAGEDSAVTQARESLLREPMVVEYSISFFPVLALVLVLRSFVVEPYQIPTGSMIPSLLVGDFILVNKYAYGLRLPVIGTKFWSMDEPSRGEVMVFIPPHDDRYFIKRVIGVPGDHILYENKTLYINGEPQEQQLVARLPAASPRYLVMQEQLGEVQHTIHRDMMPDRTAGEWFVPDGHYFMMGDNRDRSSDSRMWGMVPEANIRGKAFAIWMHKEPGLNLPQFNRNGWIE